MIKQPTRYETNQKIKRTLVSHGAHLGDLTFSFTGKAAFFTGRLNKISGTPMAYQAVENLCKALITVPYVRFLNFEMEDWTITLQHSSFSITPKTIAASTQDRDVKPLVISSNETIEDVLKER
jgi:hypothetical protein